MEDRGILLAPQPSEGEIRRLLERYPLPEENGKTVSLDYGTAGFRYKATILEPVMVRVGILAAYRSSQLRQHIGVMVTASHNDESYNGVKLADPHGGMMAPDGEAMAVQFVNAPTAQEIFELLSDGTTTTATSALPTTAGVVHVGRDTRSHSPALTQLLIRAAQAMGAHVVLHGVVTTPILHYCVMMSNPHYLPPLIPPRPNVQGYYDQIANAYMGLLCGIQKNHDSTTTEDDNHNTTSMLAQQQQQQPLQEPLVVDCACGVGYAHVHRLNETLQRLGARRILLPKNAPDDGPLNEGCGSEHVQKHVMPPQWYSEDDEDAGVASNAITYAASVDGDSDRIVFFSQTPKFTLLDGDKIAVLLCDFLQEQVSSLETALHQRIHETTTSSSSSATQNPSSEASSLKLGVVQTAYANGASTTYLKQILGEERVLIAKTGVKYVHEAAHHHFDIGVYFEANGHGTVLFGDAYYKFLAHADQYVRGHIALQRLQLLPALINQAVGDALSDLLLVDAILQIKGWNIDDWNALYTDLPSRQCKVEVEDRTMILTNTNETECTSPVELQHELNAAMARCPGSRCFVRPSGTENVVRVYAEAQTPQQADELATQAAKLVHTICHGVGEPPVFPSSKM